jgi:hypothetical protein
MIPPAAAGGGMIQYKVNFSGQLPPSAAVADKLFESIDRTATNSARMHSVLLSLSLLATSAVAIDLSGRWNLTGSSENYLITPLDLSHGLFDVACVGGPCTAWKTASLNITDEIQGLLIIRFDSGLVHNGSLNMPYATVMSWQDGSSWVKLLTGSFTLHFIQHSHTGACGCITCRGFY